MLACLVAWLAVSRVALPRIDDLRRYKFPRRWMKARARGWKSSDAHHAPHLRRGAMLHRWRWFATTPTRLEAKPSDGLAGAPSSCPLATERCSRSTYRGSTGTTDAPATPGR